MGSEPPPELQDGAPPAAEAPPHYHGHRARLRARFRDSGGQAMPDYEILELLLALALPRRDVKPLAKGLIARFGSFAGVIAAPLDRLEAEPGLGEAAAVALKLVREAALRLLAAEVMDKPAIASWGALLDYCRARLGRESREEVRVLYLDRRNVLIADEPQGHGTVDQAPLYVREVVKRALEHQASAVILVHNHVKAKFWQYVKDLDFFHFLGKRRVTACYTA